MDKAIAKKIGQSLAIKCALIGLAIAYTIFGGLLYRWDGNLGKAVFWLIDVEFAYPLVVGALGLLAMAYLFGQWAGAEILIKNRNEYWTGIKYGLVILVTGTLIGSSVGFMKEGVHNIGSDDDPFFDYYFKPLYWVTLCGMLPVIVVGSWFGMQIKKQ